MKLPRFKRDREQIGTVRLGESDLKQAAVKKTQTVAVPSHVSLVLSYLEHSSYTAMDLFIFPGEWTQVMKLKKLFAKGLFVLFVCKSEFSWVGKVTSKTLTDFDPFVISDTFLSWFSNMPEPLFTFELYEAWMSAKGSVVG